MVGTSHVPQVVVGGGTPRDILRSPMDKGQPRIGVSYGDILKSPLDKKQVRQSIRSQGMVLANLDMSAH